MPIATKILITLSLALSAQLAEAKIIRLSSSQITGLKEVVVGKCQSGWGERMNVVIQTTSEKFVFIYCSDQPLSAPMSEVYPRLREFVSGPSSGSCQIKTYCDQWNRCSYAPGRLESIRHELVLITNEKNQIVEDFNDIQINADSVCRPVNCGY